MLEIFIGRKVFVSYSWSTPEHQDWVLMLSKRLISDGVDIVLDKWDLKEGNDKHVFMEQMVQSAEIDKVLMICDQRYAEKADERAGGVGTETTIISASVYNHSRQEKFIPIVRELDHEGNPCLPHYLKSTIYIDMHDDEHFEIAFEKLLRIIYERPQVSKPLLGKPPKYLFEASAPTFKTTDLLKKFLFVVEKQPERIASIFREFSEELIESLGTIKVERSVNDDIERGKRIVEAIEQYTPLRNDYVLLIDRLTKSQAVFDLSLISTFFEDLHSLLLPDEGMSSWNGSDYAEYRFVINELFLYTVGLAMKNEHHSLLDHLFNSRYFIRRAYRFDKLGETFVTFGYRVTDFAEFYVQSRGGSLRLAQADFLVKRTPENLKKQVIIDADLLCSYIADLKDDSWYAMTYIFKDEDEPVTYLSRIASKSYFEKIKVVFEVNDAEELRKKVKSSKAKERFSAYASLHRNAPSIQSEIDVEKIAIFR